MQYFKNFLWYAAGFVSGAFLMYASFLSLLIQTGTKSPFN